jgi:hypothetical protein
MVRSLEPIAPGVVDELGRGQAIAKVVLTVTDTRPAANDSRTYLRVSLRTY